MLETPIFLEGIIVLLFLNFVIMLRSFQRSNSSLMIRTFAKPIDGQEESLDDVLALVKLQSARQRRSDVVVTRFDPF